MKVLEASRSRLEAIASRLEVWGTKGKGHAVTGRLALEVLEAWRRHSNGFCNEPFLITDENVREAVPDLPEEYFRLPYPAAKSDFIRYAVLHHHGGVYIDFDMLTIQDVDQIVKKVKKLDLVSYSDGQDGSDCRGFSSNFLGGRKNSSFHLAVWEAQKAAVSQHCNISEKGLEKVCCFDDTKQECHIPWGGLGEQISHKVFAASPPKSAFCFSGDESFNPDRFEFVLEHKQKMEEAEVEFNAKKVARPFDRGLYHFFNALHGWEKHSCADLFNNSTVVGHLFSKSFSSGRGSKPRKGKESDSFLRWHPEFQNVSKNYIVDGRPLPCALGQ
ncbi:Isoamylase 3 [Durusdinium trenchii]|uniref:Chloroplastic n=1 Tax=Durusdinium trenchii TaxID=1381693 RepID=A0ABP0KYQ8_9DINO